MKKLLVEAKLLERTWEVERERGRRREKLCLQSLECRQVKYNLDVSSYTKPQGIHVSTR